MRRGHVYFRICVPSLFSLYACVCVRSQEERFKTHTQTEIDKKTHRFAVYQKDTQRATQKERGVTQLSHFILRDLQDLGVAGEHAGGMDHHAVLHPGVEHLWTKSPARHYEDCLMGLSILQACQGLPINTTM